MGFPLSYTGVEMYPDGASARAALAALVADLRARPRVRVHAGPDEATYRARPLGRSWSWTAATDAGAFRLQPTLSGTTQMRYTVRTRGLFLAGLLAAALAVILIPEPLGWRLGYGALGFCVLTGGNYLLAVVGLRIALDRARRAGERPAVQPSAT